MRTGTAIPVVMGFMLCFVLMAYSDSARAASGNPTATSDRPADTRVDKEIGQQFARRGGARRAGGKRPGSTRTPGRHHGTKPAHRPGNKPAHRPGKRPGHHVNVRHRHHGWRGRHWGAVVFGVTLGTAIIVAANTPPYPPDPSLCWTWSNSALTRGYWYYCDGY